jgi:uncharacterized membrane protein YfcA
MTLNLMIALILTIAVGVTLGMLGSGGAIVMLPILVYVADTPPQEAVSMSLAIVGGTSLVGAIMQYRQGNVHRAATISFLATGIVGAFLGSYLTHIVSQQTLMLLFSLLMASVGWAMLRKRKKVNQAQAHHQFSVVKCLSIGAIIGVLTGFLGVGGGFLIVPALVLFIGLEIKKAIGTSMAVVAVNSASGLAGHAREVTINWQLTAQFLIVALIGMQIGTWYASRIPHERLRTMFAWFVIFFALAIASINGYSLLARSAG